ncbi:hypothetical protein ACJMK2_006668 [Sinanodonta woodiana]|uniref:Uncharacterized protein n=1 Tax=Sinanodonta woodiana TaxID=1069815 RepID=A0ABD3VUK9_SINWO
MNMFSQHSVKDSRAEYDNTINVSSVDNDKPITFAINPYDCYNNRFSQGQNVQHSDNQTENRIKEWAQKANFRPRDAEVCRSSHQVGLFHTNLIIMSSVPFENNGVNHGHKECNKDMSEFVLIRKWPLEHIAQHDLPDNYRKQHIDREVIVDLAANKHSRWNRTIHDYLLCPFVLFFMFFCCAPAILLMHKSDVAFRKGRDSEARRWAICSSVFYGIGLMLTLAFYAMIFALVLIYTK